MTAPETTSRAGEDLSPSAEVKTAVTGLLNEFRGFADDVTLRLKQQDDRMTKLQAKMAPSAQRPMLEAAADVGEPHRSAFAAYLRSGDESGLRALGHEGKAMSAAVSADGGYLVSPQVAEQVRAILVSTASIRQVASVVNVEAGSLDVIVDRGEVGAGWATEGGAAVETSTGTLEKVSIPLHELAAQPKASQRLIDDSAFDVDGWLAGRIAEKFLRAESAAFVNGTGTAQPRGFLDYPKVANAAWSWGSLGTVASGTTAALTNIDPVVDLVYALGAQYRAGATFVVNSKTTAALRKLKDADGRFLWSDGLAGGEPARLMGYKVLICEDMPDIGAGTNPIAFGDFAAGYTIAERPDLRLIRDQFTAKPHVLFYATKRVGGGVTDFAAIKLLRIATS